MSLQAWDWEGEEGSSMGPHSVASESEMEENLKSRIPAHDWDSEDQFSSSLHSSEGPACISNSDVPQIVPCRFEISLAFPVLIGNKGKTPNVPDKKKSAKTETRTGKARQFYHIEYFFLPDDIEPKIVDIVVFPNVAKVFLESGTKTVKPWRDDDKVWVSWSQTFHVNVTKELLKKLNFHKITLRLWDTKDRVSKRARYQRVKASAYSEDLESLEEVKHLVLSHKKLSLISIGKTNTISEELKEENLPGDQEKAEKHLKSPQEPEAPSKNDEECEKLLKMEESPLSRRTISKTPISLSGATMMEIKELIEKPSLSSLTNMLEKQKSQLKGKDTEVKKKNPKKVKRYQAEEEGDQKPETPAAWKQSIFSIQLPIMPLLAGSYHVLRMLTRHSR